LAAITAFLLSDDADWITGQVWYLGGGSHLRQ
jgi:enoyl-[acyl-carrier-protein] reductase (NADH)